MDSNQLQKGIDLREQISDVKKKLGNCKLALVSVEKETYGEHSNHKCYLSIHGAADRQGFTTQISIQIGKQQMSYALILAEKKIQKEFDSLETEFKNL